MTSRSSNKHGAAASAAASRAAMFGFLGAFYRGEPTAEPIDLLRNAEVRELLGALGYDLRLEGDGPTEEDRVEDLVLEYTRLFPGPGPHISPHESLHRPDETRPGLLSGDSTVEVKRFVEWLGLSYSTDYKGIPDHIAVELELMRRIIERERAAEGTGGVLPARIPGGLGRIEPGVE